MRLKFWDGKMKNFFLAVILVLISGCVHTWKWKREGEEEERAYLYYVIDIHGTEPDAYFDDREDAVSYVKEFQQYHTYRIVKAVSRKEHE
jgi:hypothetical protein